MLAEGKASDFCLLDSEGTERCLNEIEDKWVILYFYPRANTSGCTKEAVEFTEMKKEFEKNGAVIIGVSPDSPKTLSNFKEKHDLGITLLSDKDEKKVLEDYGVWQLKKRCGKESMGVVRSTFIISPNGEIAKSYENVKVKGHVEKVFSDLIKLKS